MTKKFFFVSGLPRSGSTLLCNLLAQNPEIHATPTCGVADLLFSLRNQWKSLVEHRANPTTGNQHGAMSGLLHGYFSHVPGQIIAVKSRAWVAYIEMLEWILGHPAKILVPVRAIPDVLSSMEKIHRRDSQQSQPAMEQAAYMRMQTVAGRCEIWVGSDQPVGLAYNRIKDAISRGFRDRLHFVRYEELTSRPAWAMEEIYRFLNQPSYVHNFENVEQVTQEDDAVYGLGDGLHTIQPTVTPRPSDAVAILGPALVAKYAAENF